jgi:hypothetical protein
MFGTERKLRVGASLALGFDADLFRLLFQRAFVSEALALAEAQ